MEGNESPISPFPVFQVIIISLFIHGLNMSYSLKKMPGNQWDSEWEVSNILLSSRETPSPSPLENTAFPCVYLYFKTILHIGDRLQTLEFLRYFWRWKDRLTKDNFHRLERFIRAEVLRPEWTSASISPLIPGLTREILTYN